MRIRYLLGFLGLLLTSTYVAAQVEYNLYNYTGLSMDQAQLNQLNSLAEDLSVLVEFYQEDSFKVFDVSYYTHTSSTIGGVNEVRIYVESLAESTGDSYVILFKEYNESGESLLSDVVINIDTVDQPCISDNSFPRIVKSKYDTILNINEDAFDGSIQFITWFTKYMEQMYCCSGVLGSRSYSCDLNLQELNSFAEMLAQSEEFNQFLISLKAIVELWFKCGTASEKGIIPKCYWENKSISWLNYYSFQDKAFVSGVIDGFYGSVWEFTQMVELLDDLAYEVPDIIRAYTTYYSLCHEHSFSFLWALPVSQQMLVLNLIKYVDGENWFVNEAFSAYHFLDSVLYDSGVKNFGWPTMEDNFELCNKYKRIRTTVEGGAEALLLWETWDTLYSSLKSSMIDVYNAFTSIDDIDRYYQGYYGSMAAASLFGEAWISKLTAKAYKLGGLTDEIAGMVNGAPDGYKNRHHTGLAVHHIDDIFKKYPDIFNDPTTRFLFKEDFEGDIEGLYFVKLSVGRVKAWDKVKHSLDAGIAAKATDVPFLQKFDEIVQNNNLGLDEDGLQAVLNAAAVKGYKWDFPENILDAVKRASDANIPNLKVTHKKFPVSSSDSYVLKNAKQFQYESSLDANLSFELNGVSFDDVKGGFLIDRKFGHDSAIWDVDGNIINERRIESLLDQAERQLTAANGQPIKWEISTPAGASNLNQHFIDIGININVVHVAQNLKL